MSPVVVPADLLPADVYERVRPRYRGRIIELKRRRRVMLGEHVSIVFESRETVLYHIQEVLRAEGAGSVERVEREIAEYDRLVPRAGEITATLMIHGGPPRAGQALMEGLAAGRDTVFLGLDARTIPAEPLSPLSDACCPVQYIRFPVDEGAARAFVDRRVAVRIGADYGGRVEMAALPGESVDELAAELRAAARRAQASPARLPRRSQKGALMGALIGKPAPDFS